MNRFNVVGVLLISALMEFSLFGCGDSASDLLKVATGQEKDARTHGDAQTIEHSAEAYDRVCARFPRSDECAKAAKAAAGMRLDAGIAYFNASKFRDAKRLFDVVLGADISPYASRAEERIASPDMKAGLEFELARVEDSFGSLRTMQALANGTSVVAPAARQWLVEERPNVLFREAVAACKSDNNERCGPAALGVLGLGRQWGDASARDLRLIQHRAVAYEQQITAAAQALRWSGRPEDAAQKLLEICDAAPNSNSCNKASAGADDIRLGIAKSAMSDFKFDEARQVLERIAKGGGPVGQEKAHRNLESEEMYRADRYLKVKEKGPQDAMADMVLLAAGNDAPAKAARLWLGKEGLSYLIQNVRERCSASKDERCADACRAMVDRFPSRPETAGARKLLADYESEPLRKAEIAVSEGRLVDAINLFEETCDRSKVSTYCASAKFRAVSTTITAANFAGKKGDYVAAKQLLDRLAAGVEGRAAALAAVSDPHFQAGLARQVMNNRLTNAKERCQSLNADCPQLVNGFVSDYSGTSEAQEVVLLLERFNNGEARVAQLMARAEKLMTKCHTNATNIAGLRECFPDQFGRYKSVGTSHLGDSLERFSLATAFSLGCKGPPSAGKAALGLVVCGSLLGAALGLARLLLSLGRWRPAVGIGLGTLLLLGAILEFGNGYTRLKTSLAPLGIALAASSATRAGK